jgi:hypothetical protein
VIAHTFGSHPKWSLVVLNQIEVRAGCAVFVVDDFFNDSQVCALTIGRINVGSETKLFAYWPYKNKDGVWEAVDRSDEMIRKLQYLGVDAVISIGGDGSQRISQQLYEKGLNIIGVPKTIDNDLSATDFTFGFQTAVQIATEAVDRLVTTAGSHNRVLVLEVMGRYAGWIALHAAIAGGAEVCLIPEIPYDIEKVVKKQKKHKIVKLYMQKSGMLKT